ncbi:hypothetical protein [Vibrio sp. FJH11]
MTKGNSTARQVEDLLGVWDIPAEAYYGIHTLRTSENFKISAEKISDIPSSITASAPNFLFRKHDNGGDIMTQRATVDAPNILDHLSMGCSYRKEFEEALSGDTE